MIDVRAHLEGCAACASAAVRLDDAGQRRSVPAMVQLYVRPRKGGAERRFRLNTKPPAGRLSALPMLRPIA